MGLEVEGAEENSEIVRGCDWTDYRLQQLNVWVNILKSSKKMSAQERTDTYAEVEP